MARVIRIILSIALCYGVYTETGFWTTVAMGLAFAYIEAHGAYHSTKDGKFWKGG